MGLNINIVVFSEKQGKGPLLSAISNAVNKNSSKSASHLQSQRSSMASKPSRIPSSNDEYGFENRNLHKEVSTGASTVSISFAVDSLIS